MLGGQQGNNGTRPNSRPQKEKKEKINKRINTKINQTNNRAVLIMDVILSHTVFTRSYFLIGLHQYLSANVAVLHIQFDTKLEWFNCLLPLQ